MKRLISSVVCAGFFFVGAQALAGDSMHSDTSNQTMKDCMAKHAAKNDGMSKSDMKKACNDEMKMHKDSADTSSSPSATTDDPTTDKTIGTAKSTNK